MSKSKVRFELPNYVNPVNEVFDGSDVTVEYDSNYGGSVTVEGSAEIDEGRYAHESDHLVIDGRKVKSNGHVFSSKDGRHLGTAESVTVTVSKDVAIELVTSTVSHDVDCGVDEIIVQIWDDSVMEQEGFIAGTDSIRMERV